MSPSFRFRAAANRVKIDLGNITTATEHTLALEPRAEADHVSSVTLQVQVAYRQLDGALRVHINTLNVPVRVLSRS